MYTLHMHVFMMFIVFFPSSSSISIFLSVVLLRCLLFFLVIFHSFTTTAGTHVEVMDHYRHMPKFPIFVALSYGCRNFVCCRCSQRKTNAKSGQRRWRGGRREGGAHIWNIRNSFYTMCVYCVRCLYVAVFLSIPIQIVQIVSVFYFTLYKSNSNSLFLL